MASNNARLREIERLLQESGDVARPSPAPEGRLENISRMLQGQLPPEEPPVGQSPIQAAQQSIGIPGPAMQLPSAGEAVQGLRESSITAGALAGGRIGMTLAGPRGLAVGGVLGAMGGTFAQQNIEDLSRFLGAEGLPPPPLLHERLLEAGSEGMLDLGLTIGAKALGLAFRGGQSVMLRSLGVGEQELRTAEEARRQGIDLGIVDVVDRGVPKFFPKVLGNFPILGTPFVRAGQEKGAQILRAQEKLMFSIGPTTSMARLGINLNRAVDKRFASFAKEIDKLYDNARNLAKERDFLIPSEEVVLSARQLQKELSNEIGEKAAKDNVFSKFIENNLRDLEGPMTMERYSGLSRQLSQAINQARKDGATVHKFFELKTELEQALIKGNDPEVISAFAEADGTFARVMRSVFETPTAQRFGRIDKQRFRRAQITRPGARNADEAFTFAFNADSPQAINDLRKLVGPRLVQQSARAHIEKSIGKALDSGEEVLRRGQAGGGINLESAKRALGLDDPTGSRAAALRESLKGSDVTLKDLDSFVSTVESVTAALPSGVNAFIARRASIGGIRGVSNALLPGASIVGGSVLSPGTALTALTVVLGITKMSKALASGKTLKNFVDALEPGQTLERRKARFLVYAGAVLDKEERTFLGPLIQDLGEEQ